MAGFNLIEWFTSIFSGGNDPEREKRRLLKQLGKDIGRSRYKFYKAKGPVALPQLGRFFFEIYKVIASAKNLLANAEKSAALKSIVIDNFLSDSELELQQSLTEESIRARAKNLDSTQLGNILKEDLIKYFNIFNADRVKEINTTYNLIQRFIQFISFDYYFAIKKFYSALREGDVATTPKYESISGDYVADDVKDFLEVALLLKKEDQWDGAFDVLRTYKGVEIVNRDAWTKVVNGMHQVLGSKILEQIAQHASQDPFYKPKIDVQTQRIVEPFLDQKKNQVEQAIQKILKERKGAKIDQLLKSIFGTTAVQRTKNYTEKNNMMFTRKDSNISGYVHTTALNYLKAFLLDVFKKDVRELQELLIVRGKWATNISSQQMSEAYYQVMNLSENLIQFDEGLAEDGSDGQRLRKAMGRVVDRDPSTLKGLRTTLDEINEQAEYLVRETGQHIISFGKVLKNALEDFKRPNHELVLNWKELDGLADHRLEEMMTEVYRKTYFFIQLLQLYVKPKKAVVAPTIEDD